MPLPVAVLPPTPRMPLLAVLTPPPRPTHAYMALAIAALTPHPTPAPPCCLPTPQRLACPQAENDKRKGAVTETPFKASTVPKKLGCVGSYQGTLGGKVEASPPVRAHPAL
eukprot:331909-Chlamydomonas_euryale.AAC.5